MDNDLLKDVLEEIKALRQDLETQTAINIIEGINTIETMAMLAHYLRRRRSPTPKEAAELERVARGRWQAQVRQAIALGKKDPGGLDQSLPDMMAAITQAPGATRRTRRKS